jgi:DNA-binding MarR family transcriptional regulator
MPKEQVTHRRPRGSPRRLDLETSIPVLLVFLGNRLNATGSATYRAHFGLGITEFRLLAMLAVEPNILAARICEVMGIDNGAASRALRALERRGLVEQQPDMQNRAYRRWRLTEAGIALHDEAVEIAAERERVLLSDFSAEEGAMLVGMLKRMLARTQDLARVRPSGEGREV